MGDFRCILHLWVIRFLESGISLNALIGTGFVLNTARVIIPLLECAAPTRLTADRDGKSDDFWSGFSFLLVLNGIVCWIDSSVFISKIAASLYNPAL